MTRTNVVLNDELVESCRKTTGIKTKKELIDFALHELLRREDQEKIMQLKGRIDWQGDLEEWRTGRLCE